MSCSAQLILTMAIFWTKCASVMSKEGLRPPTAGPIPESSGQKTFSVRSFLNSQPPQRSQWKYRHSFGLQTPTPHADIKWHPVIERLLEVRCSTEQMSIVLHYEKSYSRLPPNIVDVLRNGLLYTEAAGPDSQTCSSSNNRAIGQQEGILVLSFDYDDCGVEMGRGSNLTIVYTTTVIVQARFNITVTQPTDDNAGNVQQGNAVRDIRESYRLQCVHPLRVENVEETASFSLVLSDLKYTRSNWTYPRSVELGQLVYLYSDAALSWFKQAGLYSFPINCWTSFRSGTNPAVKGRRKEFVKDGCPVNDDRGRGLSYIHHFKDGPTKVSINIGPYLLFGGTANEYDNDEEGSTNEPARRQSENVTLSCEVVPCVQSFTLGLLNIPKCPVSYFCAGIPQLSPALPAQLRHLPRTVVSAGPLTVRSKEDRIGATTKSDSLSIANCRMACGQTQISESNAGKIQRVSSTIYIDGVKTQIVVLVAFISFSFGFIVMGALWWIHNRTDPTKRKLETTAANSEANGEPAAGASTAPSQEQQRRVFRLGRMTVHDDTSDSPSGIRPPAMADRPATTALLHQFNIIDESRTASTSKSPKAALLKRAVDRENDDANTDACAARRLLNTLR